MKIYLKRIGTLALFILVLVCSAFGQSTNNVTSAQIFTSESDEFQAKF